MIKETNSNFVILACEINLNFDFLVVLVAEDSKGNPISIMIFELLFTQDTNSPSKKLMQVGMSRESVVEKVRFLAKTETNLDLQTGEEFQI